MWQKIPHDILSKFPRQLFGSLVENQAKDQVPGIPWQGTVLPYPAKLCSPAMDDEVFCAKVAKCPLELLTSFRKLCDG